MLCVELGKIDLDLERLDKIIKKFVPSGRNVHERMKYKSLDIEKLNCYGIIKDIERINKSLGTLGGGNHFIEIDEDEEKNKYLVIHTGSRNLGKQVAEIYQNEAIEQHSYLYEMEIEKQATINLLKLDNREKEIEQKIKEIESKYKNKTKIPKDLCYLEDELRKAYLHDMKICQEFASDNRLCIAKQILCNYFELPYYEGYRSVRLRPEPAPYTWGTQDMIYKDFYYFETIHNYISFDDNIVRKGAISARLGEKVLIPINMRDGSIIAIGKGNDDWNQSAPHGAGRIMSRIKAKETFKLEDFKESMKNVYSTSVLEETIDEAPFVYKPMQEIIDNIKDTVEIKKIITPIYNFKAKN